MSFEGCVICQQDSCYKCPKCAAHTCSLKCNKEHAESCKSIVEYSTIEDDDTDAKSSSELNQLEKLKNSADLKNLLKDESLRNMLRSVDQSETPGTLLERGMKSNEKFQEFARLSQEILSNEHVESVDLDQTAMDNFIRLLQNAIDK